MKKTGTTIRRPLAEPAPAVPGQLARFPERLGQPPPPVVRNRVVRSLWYALYVPELAGLPEAVRQQHLEQLAPLATAVSSSISFHPGALVFEIRSSLRYFGGIDILHEKLASAITRQLQDRGLSGRFLYAASPTVSGSLLLARAGNRLLIYRRDNLRSALGRLSIDVLELDREQRRRLYNMGVRRLRDIWRLPADGLRKRFGSGFVNQLRQALGERPEPQQYYQPPPAFDCSYELPCEVENTALLLPVLDEFLAQLVDFLRRRDLSTSRLLVSLSHERQGSTEITLGLRQPSRCQRHLLQLLEIHLNSLTIPAPVIAVKMQVQRFDACLARSESLLRGDPSAPAQGQDAQIDHFLEQLQARLGEQPLYKVDRVAEHCPEYAALQMRPLHSSSRNSSTQPIHRPRPFWLLPEPLPLRLRLGRLYHHRPLRILSGPERIETRWWSGTDIRRDYYVAAEENGSRLWIYREKTGARGWFLHGVFA